MADRGLVSKGFLRTLCIGFSVDQGYWFFLCKEALYEVEVIWFIQWRCITTTTLQVQPVPQENCYVTNLPSYFKHI